MPRPKHCRRVGAMPACMYFKPQGVPMRILECVGLTLDELEAVRLADLEGLYQADAAERMSVSRQTFGRILDSAHKKIAEVLVHGKALRIEGGVFQVSDGEPSHGAAEPGPGLGCGRRRRGGPGRWDSGHGPPMVPPGSS